MFREVAILSNLMPDQPVIFERMYISTTECLLVCATKHDCNAVFLTGINTCRGYSDIVIDPAYLIQSPGQWLNVYVPGVCRSSGYIWEDTIKMCYTFHTGLSFTVFQAAARCHKESAHLLVITSESLFTFAQKFIDVGTVDSIHLDGFRINEYSPWKDMYGNTINFFGWDVGEPKTDHTQKYLRMNENSLQETTTGYLRLPFICVAYN